MLGVNFAGDPSNLWEQSEYAEPTPMPAANATDAHLVTGLPDTNDYGVRQNLNYTRNFTLLTDQFE